MRCWSRFPEWPRQPAINIVGSGTGTGRVQANGIDGLDCTVSPSGSTGTCSRVSDFSTATTLSFLTIVPAPGSVFVGWSGLCTGNGGCTTTGDFPPNTQLVARFDLEATPPALRTLIVSGAGKGSGAVQSSPAGVACTITNGVAPEGHGCSADFAQDQLVMLTAATSFPNRFVGWIGPCDGTSPCTLGNNNGIFDIGDLLAYLDRTGQKLTPPDAAAQKAVPPTPPAARTPRRNP